MKIERVMERIYDPKRLQTAWKQVRTNAGAAGINKMTVKDFEEKEEYLLNLIREKLNAGTYRFKAARRVLKRAIKAVSKAHRCLQCFPT